MLLRQELEEKLRSQTKELASEQRSANAMKKALASARDELAAAQELRRSDCDNLRRAQQAAKRDIKAAERMADEVTHAARADFEWRIGEMRAKMQAELREQLDALQISMEAEARRADAAEAGAAAYASSATSNVVVSQSSTATAGVISVQHKGSFSRTLVSTDTQTTLRGSDIHAAASAEMLLRQELEEKLRSRLRSF